VAQNVFVNEEDCGTKQGVTKRAIYKGEQIDVPLRDAIVGRVARETIANPITDEIIVAENQIIVDESARKIEALGIDTVMVRSPLTCDSRYGICRSCYGQDMSTGQTVEAGLAVGIIAAQSIGEPGTQLTLRTFHVGGTAQRLAAESQIKLKRDGVIQFQDIHSVKRQEEDGEKDVVVGRHGYINIVGADSGKQLSQHHIPYGSILHVEDGQEVGKGQIICNWDPYNAVILADQLGKVEFENVIEGVTYREEIDEQTGVRQKIVVENRDKTVNPVIRLVDNSGDEIRSYNIPVGANIIVDDNQSVKAGQIMVKIPRVVSKTSDITGGLPRVTELFEARNPSNPAVVSEIEGIVALGTIKRGNREVIVTTRDGSDERRYMVPLSKHILVQDNDLVYAGSPLSDGAITPIDILRIKGMGAVQEYIVNEIQAVYRLQGVGINNKHIEVIVSQMMRKVEIIDPGDTDFLEKEVVDRVKFQEANDWIFDKKFVLDAGDSQDLRPGMIINLHKHRDENSALERKEKKLVQVRDARPAIAQPTLQGITRSSLGTDSFMSAASFQETTKVLSEAAITAKQDELLGLKENVIVGHLVPAGTGMRMYEEVEVMGKQEKERQEAEAASADEVDLPMPFEEQSHS